MLDILSRFWFQLTYVFTHLTTSDGLDMLLVTLAFFVVFQALRRTRALQLLNGIILFVLVGGLLVILLPFRAFNLLIGVSLLMILVALPYFFQNELRQIFIRVSSWSRKPAAKGSALTLMCDAILESVLQLSNKSTGALIILEGATSLAEIMATGVAIQADAITTELLQNIFYDKSPLHDGAVLIQGTTLAAAGCILPVAQDDMDSSIGTRHRAALGMVQLAPDALAIIVSEETGNISVAHKGQLFRAISVTRLADWLDRFYSQNIDVRKGLRTLFRNTSKQAFFRNLAISFGLAISLWVIVTYQVNPPQQVMIPDVPLVVQVPPTGFQLVSPPPSSVEIVVQTDQENLEQMDMESLRATIDLSQLGAGVHTVPVHVNLPQNGSQIFSITPEIVTVTLEEVAIIQMAPTLEVLDIDTLGVAYYLGGATFSPEMVTIQGPRSLVEQVETLKVFLTIGNRRTNFQESLSLVATDASGKPIMGLRFEPAHVFVNADVRRNIFTVELPVQPVLRDNLPQGLEVTAISVNPQVITLAGTRSVIDTAPVYLETTPIDLSRSTSEFTISVPLIVPEGMTALGPDGETVFAVEVVVTIQPVTDYLILNVRPTVESDSLLGPASLTPATITVLLIGPRPLLEQIRANPATVRLTLDITGLEPGTHTVTVTVLVPEGVRVELFPGEVRVTIE